MGQKNLELYLPQNAEIWSPLHLSDRAPRSARLPHFISSTATLFKFHQLKDAAVSIFGASLLENRQQATILQRLVISDVRSVRYFHSLETEARGTII